MENAVQLYQTKARSFINLVDFAKMHGNVQVHDRRTAISPEMLADFFSSIVQSSTEADDLVTPFVSKLVAKAPQLPAGEFHALWLPFLRCLIPILASNTIPLTTPYCQQLFSALLKAYLDRYVGHKPAKERSLVRPAVRCRCADCNSLNAFLASRTERVGFFAVNKQRRAHLHQQLDSCKVDCTYETRRSGSPQTLVVTKTCRHDEKRLLDWKSRLMLAKKQIQQQFDNAHLVPLLGASYPTIVNMEHLLAAEPAQGQPPPPVASASPRTTSQPPRRLLQAIGSAGSSQPQPPPVAGVKRKASPAEIEVIDLTSE